MLSTLTNYHRQLNEQLMEKIKFILYNSVGRDFKQVQMMAKNRTPTYTHKLFGWSIHSNTYITRLLSCASITLFCFVLFCLVYCLKMDPVVIVMSCRLNNFEAMSTDCIAFAMMENICVHTLCTVVYMCAYN